MNILPDMRYFRFGGKNAMVCGWGAVTTDDQISDEIMASKYTDNLQCMSVSLIPYRVCTRNIEPGDFKRYLLCAKGEYPDQTMTLVTTI